jgi:very-short-patch-repair endonuclease
MQEYWVNLKPDTSLANKTFLKLIDRHYLISNTGKVGHINKTHLTPKIITDQIMTSNGELLIKSNSRSYKEKFSNVVVRSLTGLDPHRFNITEGDLTSSTIKINNRSIDKISLYRYENSKNITVHEKIFYDTYTSFVNSSFYNLFHFYQLDIDDKLYSSTKVNLIRSIRETQRFRNSVNSQKVIFNDYSFYLLDYYWEKLNICLEVDGNFHYYDENFSNDNKRTEYLKKNYDIDVLRIANLRLSVKSEERTKVIKQFVKILLLKVEVVALKISNLDYSELEKVFNEEVKNFNNTNLNKALSSKFKVENVC